MSLRNLNLPLSKKGHSEIIANHAVTPGSEQLMMYVGAWEGTGKSQSSSPHGSFIIQK